MTIVAIEFNYEYGCDKVKRIKMKKTHCKIKQNLISKFWIEFF